MRIRALVVFGAALLLSACATTRDRIIHVDRGMSSEQVLDVMGKPKDRTFRGKQEHWVYPGSDGERAKLIVFENGKVVEMLNAEAESKVMHEVASADINTQGNKVYHCTGSNEFGRFPEGGGCNLYGCWTPGGYCNQWGCSAQGSCNNKGCPGKVASHQCQD
jgi:hypothetical protein